MPISSDLINLIESIEMNWVDSESKKDSASYKGIFRGQYVVFYVDLDKLWDQLDNHSRFIDSDQIGNRYQKIQNRAMDNLYFDPVELYYIPHERKFSLNDGRHRTLFAHNNKIKKIPVFTPKYHYDEYKQEFDKLRVGDFLFFPKPGRQRKRRKD